MDASDMKITRALGKGAHNLIFEVDWLGCKLAAKYYLFVLHEVKQLSKLRHPHVVQIVGYSKIEDLDVMIMELMDGNLEDLIKDCMQKNGSSNSGPFSQEVTLDILYQIARGMQYLHDQGLGHGQLKCSNVLVRTHNSDSIEVKVADFGYANKVSKKAMYRTGSGVETIGQMDVLDFAQIWCAISSGILPADDNHDWRNRISFGEHGPQFAIPSERLSPEVEGLVKACLNSVARERPTFEEICHLLDHIRAPKPTYLEPQKSPAWSLKGMFENVLNKVTKFCKCNLAEEAQQVCMDLPSYLRIRQSCIILLGEIGQGSSATVYEAEWMGVKFAVKSICAEMHSIQLQREVGVWIKLRHPRIVQLMGFSVAKNSSLIVMELLGGDLRKLIDTRMASMKEGGPFMRREALDVMVQIAEGMAYLHKQGIMHRDLKSLNVLVVAQSRPIHVKIADFGISKYINTPSERGAVGTGFWRAPEVLSSLRDGITQPTYTSKADVYSYGMTCYEVLTGLIPFDGHPRADYSLVLSGNRPQLPTYVSDDVADLITRCWHQEPEQRPEFLDICHKLRSLMKAT
jgi:serine/threonine protein kinase